jgi:hypothetical protein
MVTNSEFRKASAPRVVFSYLFVVLLTLGVLAFDNSLLDQMRELLSSGRLPNFAACVRLVAYFISTYALAKWAHKYPAWMISSASALSFVLFALFM